MIFIMTDPEEIAISIPGFDGKFIYNYKTISGGTKSNNLFCKGILKVNAENPKSGTIDTGEGGWASIHFPHVEKIEVIKENGKQRNNFFYDMNIIDPSEVMRENLCDTFREVRKKLGWE
jgi:hypothetical protein